MSKNKKIQVLSTEVTVQSMQQEDYISLTDIGKVADIAFFLFQALKFFNQVKLEFHRYPRRKFKGNIFVSIGSAIAPGF